MAIELYWYDDAESVMILGFRPGWTWQDYKAALRNAPQMWQGKTYRIDFINDLTHPKADIYPAGLGFTNIERGRSVQPLNRGVTVWAGHPHIMLKMRNIYRKLYQLPERDVIRFDTVEEAYQYILQLRADHTADDS